MIHEIYETTLKKVVESLVNIVVLTNLITPNGQLHHFYFEEK